MRPLSLVGTSLLFAGCLAEGERVTDGELVADGEPCAEEGAESCATDLADEAGYRCIEGVWRPPSNCRCVDEEVHCSDVDIGFTGIDRAGVRPAAGRRLRIA